MVLKAVAKQLHGAVEPEAAGHILQRWACQLESMRPRTPVVSIVFEENRNGEKLN